ncbi:MAG: hypothetical protein GEU75_17350 [Dehalococcoidia bacterium]|nr:hypothetical protein [Dehalococcoidia bacterium]
MIANYQADAILEPHKAKLLEVVATAVQNYYSDDSSLKVNHSKGTRSSIINDEMRAAARRVFGNVSGVAFTTKRGMFLLYVDNQIAIRFKKLTRRLLAQNHPTQQALAFSNQKQLGQQLGPLPGTPDPMTHVNVGYQMNALDTGVSGIYAACPNGEMLAWAIDLLHLGGASGSGVPSPISPVSGSGPGVILRTKDATKGGEKQKRGS